MNKINATIEAKKSYGIYFKAFRFGEPVTAEEALVAQAELGYDPRGYGFDAFSIYKDQGGTWYAVWSCSSTC